ncbi:MAG TPA: matrixin family metalloprotease [Myxococcota bacterium]
MRVPTSAAVITSLVALAALAALAGLAGCGDASTTDGDGRTFDACSPVLLAPDASASAAEKQSVSDGAALWNALLHTRYALADTSAAASTPRIPVHFDAAAENFHGLYDGERAEVFVNQAISDDHERAIVVAHELGHSLGLLHVDEDSVMRADNTKTAPNDRDRGAVVAIWGACASEP